MRESLGRLELVVALMRVHTCKQRQRQQVPPFTVTVGPDPSPLSPIRLFEMLRPGGRLLITDYCKSGAWRWLPVVAFQLCYELERAALAVLASPSPFPLFLPAYPTLGFAACLQRALPRRTLPRTSSAADTTWRRCRSAATPQLFMLPMAAHISRLHLHSALGPELVCRMSPILHDPPPSLPLCPPALLLQEYAAMLQEAGFDGVAALDRTAQVTALCSVQLISALPSSASPAAATPMLLLLDPVFPAAFRCSSGLCWSGSWQRWKRGAKNGCSSWARRHTTRCWAAGAASWRGCRRGSSSGGCSAPSAPQTGATSTGRSSRRTGPRQALRPLPDVAGHPRCHNR